MDVVVVDLRESYRRELLQQYYDDLLVPNFGIFKVRELLFGA